MVAVHQFVQSYVQHDAVSNHVRHTRTLLREMGFDSEIFWGEQRVEDNPGKYFREFSPKPGDKTWMMYHLSTATPLTEFLLQRSEPLATVFHNITPVELIAPWEPIVGNDLNNARLQYLEIARRTDFAVGVSQFNADEMMRDGFPTARVANVLFSPEDYTTSIDPATDAKLRSQKEHGGKDWLFVGRIAGNKCQHDIIKAFAYYRRYFDTSARLHLVGGLASHRYWTTLHDYVVALQLSKAVNLTGGVSDGQLGAYYKNADVFVSMSEHEGFGVPLLEAMHNGLPVVAFGSSAVPETVASGGLVLNDKSPASVAVAVNKVLDDNAVNKQLIHAGHQRVEQLSLKNVRNQWRGVINEMVESK